jgi:hypothetical protein
MITTNNIPNSTRRFGIQEKVDAWNARFMQGKKKFDAWEQNNEIGRLVLASFRTAWLIEEKWYVMTNKSCASCMYM